MHRALSSTLRLVVVAASVMFATGCLAASDGEADDTLEEVDELDDELSVKKAWGEFECDRSQFNCKPVKSPTGWPRFNAPDGHVGWRVAADTPVYDGAGNFRGTIVRAARKCSEKDGLPKCTGKKGYAEQDYYANINAGQRKRLTLRDASGEIIGTETVVYAWAVATTIGAISGWIPEDRVRGNIEKMPTLKPRSKWKSGKALIDGETFTITGGDPAAYGDVKVNKNYSDGGRAATDYLARPSADGQFVNILYALPLSGGFSSDTVPVGMKFTRAKGVKELETDLYEPGSSVKSPKRLSFVYGHVNGRYGWVARQALNP